MTQLVDILNKSINDILYYDKKNGIEKIIKCVFEGILYAERSDFLKNANENKGNGYYLRLLL